ncbi:MAG: hypothetical protein AAB596_02145 [Patescibacteria group bacterium]
MKKISQENEAEIVWQIPEYEYQPKDVNWFWLSLILAIIMLAFSFWQENFLFAIFVLIAFFVVNVFARRFPPIWEFKINKSGISLNLTTGENKRFYGYNDIESFDIHDAGEEYKELILQFHKKFSPHLKINIHSSDEEKIKRFLTQFIKQEEIEPLLIDSLSKLIRF